MEDLYYDKEENAINKNANAEKVGVGGNIHEDQNFFKIAKSSASCSINQIEGFIYGAQSSRFWMLRKYLISMPKKDEKKLNYPKSWNCITLQYNNRDVDLVIPDDHDMKMFLKFLVFSLKTVDGQRGSG